MANDDWKERVGIKINLSSDSSEDEEVNKYEEDWKGNHLSPQHDSTEGSMDGGQLLLDDILNEYGDYGTTPPRTRISRRIRQRKQKEKEDEIKKSPKTIQAKTKRRNTLDSLFFCELLQRSENNPQDQQEDEQEQSVENTKRNKRSIKLLRGSERDLKLDIGGPEYISTQECEDRAESMPPLIPQMAMKVETCNRFMSLTSKLVACKQLAKCAEVSKETSGCPEERINFYNTFSKLIRMGSNDKQADKNPRRHLSREEHLWQNELKDLIWLELQAWHADRTPTEQDEYLCKAREQVGDLLNVIMSYKFEKRALLVPQQNGEPLAPLSTQSSDSGVSADGREDCCDLNSTNKKCVCTGCLSMYCLSCIEIQNQALRDVEQLLNRLEAAEALYPSSKAFANQHPLFKCPEFTGRVKAMCLWYNMTKHHRLKMKIIGKLMYLHQPKNCSWPPVGPLSEDDPTTSSGVATDTSDDTSYQDLHNVSRTGSLERRTHLQLRNRTVQFDLDSSSPSDSNNSNVSHGTNITSSSSEGPMEFSENINDYYNMCTISNMSQSFCTYKSSSNPYRKYMEEVLKTRGLKKAIYFLEKLHKHILHKAMITLQRPVTKTNEKTEESLKETCSLDTDKTETADEQQTEDEEEAELRRYGYWSNEAQSLSLPSYRSAFLFLSRIPFEMIHEFLRMRLEQKPHHPSVLSIRQLMRELKEGLRIAVLHKQRYLQLTQAALWNVDKDTRNSTEVAVEDFDQSMKKVLEVYLDYMRQWVLMVQQEGYRKNLLEEEWCFVRITCPKIPGGEGLASETFCLIASSMLQAIVDRLLLRAEQLNKHIFNGGELSDDESSPKQLMLLVCREFQSLFNETREKSLKAICFSKMLRKDLEEGNFGHGISKECKIIINNSLEELKNKTLTLRDAVTSTIRVAEETCDVRDMSEVDEVEKAALVSRCREILHQSYKFGFEYHKEVCRLVTGDARHKLARGMISFAQQWMYFVKERCERGRGLRPRWANQGLDFLMTVCEPQNTQYLTDAEFEELKKNIDDCISHVIGTATPNNHSPQFISSRPSLEHHYPRSRGSSPAPHSRSKTPSYRASRSQCEATSPQAGVPTQRSLSAQNSQCSGESPGEQGDEQIEGVLAHTISVPARGFSRRARVEQAIKELERELEKKLRTQELIGSVTDVESEDKIHIRSRSVTFSWQRGIKIGQGRFGKVYTAVNNETGELMAMKEIQLQPNDHRTIRRIAEELRIFEGIHHNNLIRYYGVEIHREEMLIFMEFCAEGTLESLVAATETGLPEVLIRRYTQQLLRAVVTLHQHGVVHRDIKSANIFLTDEGNCLKLGDFGSAVKIKAHTTMPGELQGFVGTQAYMAPEVFMKTNTEGHGRAADVWSVGCVVVEMASGKRPWAEYDSNYQIMFKVGMGETPPVPESLSEEGHQFLDLCLQHDPRKRATAANLLHHTFVKVDEDEECSALPSVLEDFLALNKNTKHK